MIIGDCTICDRPRENWPSSHLGMIVEIPILKVVIFSIASFQVTRVRPALNLIYVV